MHDGGGGFSGHSGGGHGGGGFGGHHHGGGSNGHHHHGDQGGGFVPVDGGRPPRTDGPRPNMVRYVSFGVFLVALLIALLVAMH